MKQNIVITDCTKGLFTVKNDGSTFNKATYEHCS